MKSQRRPRSRRRRSFSLGPLIRRWAGPLVTLALVSLLVGGAALYLVLAPYARWAAEFDLAAVENMPQTTIVYDRNGYVVQRMFEENRIFVSQEEIPDVVRHAVIATEDKRFYQHGGFDLFSTIRAAFQNLFGSRIVSGASTITQQLARNSAGITERTIPRKLKELFLALRLERHYSKEAILTFYLNRIYFGKQNYGIATAAEAYFGKRPKDLTLSEAAMLAGIISGPNAFSPWGNPEPVKARAARSRALRRMMEQGYITRAQAEAAEAEPLAIRPIIQHPGSHAVAALRDMLPEFLARDDLVRGGLRIYTTLDVSFQRAAEEQLEAVLSEIESTRGYRHPTRKSFLQQGGEGRPDYLQGAFIALSNQDGGILALVGGRNFEESTFNRALFGARQVGSTLKPLVYANAFNTLNLAGCSEIDTSPFDLQLGFASGAIPVGPNPRWQTIRQALQSSNNYAAMRAAVASGLDNFAYLVEQASGARIDPYPSSALGACSLTPLQLASAYTVFASGGLRRIPYLVTHVTDESGKILYQAEPRSTRVLSPEIAFQIHSLLTSVINSGTGRAARSTYKMEGELGGKTGTTNDFKDSWFAGYSSAVTAVAWVGFDEPKTVMAGGYASRLALPVWARIMKLAEPHYPPEPFTPPQGLTWTRPQIHLGLVQLDQPGTAQDYLRPDQMDGNFLARLEVMIPSDAHLQAAGSLPFGPTPVGTFLPPETEPGELTSSSPASPPSRPSRSVRPPRKP
ncbi:MAG: PBP1A family penicillin-binding protein [Candidatus Methylacidiphilales bacterium]